MHSRALNDVVDRLAARYGQPPAPPSTDPFELILWENVAYMASDERRAEAIAQLRRSVGTTPDDIFRAAPEDLAGATRLGILPATSVEKLRRCAQIAVDGFGGAPGTVLDLPVDRAKRALRRFPGIGEPGAEKILLLCRRHPSLAPESNALRVLVRLGICPTDRTYAKTYAAARDVAREELGDDMDRLTLARHVLRRHGQVTCRNKDPRCDECILRSDCRYASESRKPREGDEDEPHDQASEAR